ncbi:MAG: aquaporin [Acidimicrobiales bacterium]
MLLILGGPGSAILATGGFFPDGSIGVLGVALAFGLSLLVAAYAIGPISGCHINPAVTFGSWLAGKTRTSQLPAYLVGQVVGAAVGGLVLFIVTGTIDGFDAEPATFAVNGWDDLSPGGFGFWAMVLMEIIMTAVLVFVVLSTTRTGYSAAVVGVHVGLALTLIHLISIPIDNTSVNPVRSFAVAIFAGGDALEQLWAFIVFPLVGAAVGWLAHLALDGERG